MSELPKREQDGRVLRLRLNSPGKRNALSREMCLELLAAFRNADADPGTGAVLLGVGVRWNNTSAQCGRPRSARQWEHSAQR